MKIKNILITGGLHGDEPTGIEVAGFFEKSTTNICGLVCNSEAIKTNKRYIETDLNRSFNVACPISLEEKIADKLTTFISKFNLVIDIHNTRALGTTCAIVVNNPNNLQLSLSKYFGFQKIVVMPPSGSLISISPEESISLEIAKDAMERFSSKKLINKILKLKVGNLSKYQVGGQKIYVFVNKVLRSTLDRLGLYKSNFSNFKKLTRLQQNKLELPGEGIYYPIFLKHSEDEEIAFTLVKETDVKYKNG